MNPNGERLRHTSAIVRPAATRFQREDRSVEVSFGQFLCEDVRPSTHASMRRGGDGVQQALAMLTPGDPKQVPVTK